MANNRRTKTSASILVLALSLVAATQARAVPWSSIASGCVLQSDGADRAYVDAAFGTVSFAPAGSGHIKLTCPVRSPVSASVNALALTFYNDHSRDDGVDHCYINADLLRSNLDNNERGWDLGWIRTAGRSYAGRQLLYGALSEALDFDVSYYWVDVELYRDSDTAPCNPAVVGTFLTVIIP